MTDDETKRLIQSIQSRYAEIMAIREATIKDLSRLRCPERLECMMFNEQKCREAMAALIVDIAWSLESGRAPEQPTMQ